MFIFRHVVPPQAASTAAEDPFPLSPSLAPLPTMCIIAICPDFDFLFHLPRTQYSHKMRSEVFARDTGLCLDMMNTPTLPPPDRRTLPRRANPVPQLPRSSSTEQVFVVHTDDLYGSVAAAAFAQAARSTTGVLNSSNSLENDDDASSTIELVAM